jgi:hypothetical protein
MNATEIKPEQKAESKETSSCCNPIRMCKTMMHQETIEGEVDLKAGPAAGCPMAGMFRDLKAAPAAGWLMLIPGIALIAGGILVFIYPMILVWLLGGITIVLGAGMTAMALFMTRMFGHMQRLTNQLS